MSNEQEDKTPLIIAATIKWYNDKQDERTLSQFENDTIRLFSLPIFYKQKEEEQPTEIKDIEKLAEENEGTVVIEYNPEMCRIKSKVGNIDFKAKPEEVIKFCFEGWMKKVRELAQKEDSLQKAKNKKDE